MPLTGKCHCGNLAVHLSTDKSLSELPIRRCLCSFCRKHGSRATSDPQACAEIKIQRPEALSKYQFGLKTAEFLVCRECGIYVASVFADGEATFATFNLNVFDGADGIAGEGEPMNYEGESREARIERRKQRWTPAVVVYPK